MATATRKDLERLARAFRALADGTRLRIVDRLRGGEECVCNLTDLLACGQSLLSFHLKILKEAGLLRDRRQGRWVYYSLNPDALAEAERALRSLAPAHRAPAAAGRA